MKARDVWAEVMSSSLGGAIQEAAGRTRRSVGRSVVDSNGKVWHFGRLVPGSCIHLSSSLCSPQLPHFLQLPRSDRPSAHPYARSSLAVAFVGPSGSPLRPEPDGSSSRPPPPSSTTTSTRTSSEEPPTTHSTYNKTPAATLSHGRPSTASNCRSPPLTPAALASRDRQARQGSRATEAGMGMTEPTDLPAPTELLLLHPPRRHPASDLASQERRESPVRLEPRGIQVGWSGE